MKREIQISKYSKSKGLEYIWEAGFCIESKISSDGQIHLKLNKSGLISLAKQLLTLAEDNVPVGVHYHYDEHNSLEERSCPIVIEKI